MTVREVSPVQFYTFDDPRKLRVYRERLQKLQMDKIIQCGSGFALSWDNYKERVGEVRGISMAIELWEQIEKEGRE